jgi:REP element-mobilizing transposase RayT
MPYWSLYYHFVWSVKHRLPQIHPTFEQQLHSIVAAKSIELGATVHAVGGMEDHLHLAASVPPKIPLSRFIGEVKGNSSHFINHIIKPGLEFHWQEEYGVVSFREKDLPFVVRYVRDQRNHHCGGKVIDKLEVILPDLEAPS